MVSQNKSLAGLRMTAIFFTSVCCSAAVLGLAAPLTPASATPSLPVRDAGTLPSPAPAIDDSAIRPSSEAEQPAPTATWQMDTLYKAEADAEAIFGKQTLKPGQFMWSKKADEASGTPFIVVSISDQLAYVYRGDKLVALTTTSTGKRGHQTPVGTFKVTQKRKVHFSSKYNNAPMPYMQRLTDYGIALHAGAIPGYPASHGCVRLPHKFAADLFKVTSVGTTVLIAA